MRAARPHGTGLRRGYTVQNPFLLSYLRCADAVLRMLVRARPQAVPHNPRRILLAASGHLGDAVVLTASIEWVAQAFPEAELGVVLPSWSRVVIANDTRVKRIHSVDHWKVNRSPERRWRKWWRYLTSARQATREIRSVAYDVAIDLYTYFPNMAVPLWRAGIPVRAGFSSGGYGRLYTHPFPWSETPQSMASRQVACLRELFAHRSAVHETASTLASPRDVQERVASLLASKGVGSGGYLVIHMGSGAAERTWPADRWRAMVDSLGTRYGPLVFTGHGNAERQAIRLTINSRASCVDLSGQLAWEEFVQVIAGADILVTVETAAAHVAAATGTACVALWWSPLHDPTWQPVGARVELLDLDATPAMVATAVQRVCGS